MDEKKRLWQAVYAARRSLLLEKLILGAQKGLLYAVLSATIVYIVSRLFVLPYYSRLAIGAAILAFLWQLMRVMTNRLTKKDALILFDAYFTHNELLTALTAKEENGLVQSLVKQAFVQKDQALQAFKKRPQKLFQLKVLATTFGLFVLLLGLIALPATTQQEAKVVEADRTITKKIDKEVEEQLKKELSENTKKEMEELKKALEEAETSEQALKELVKKQKELMKQEQQLTEQQQNNELSAGELQQLNELASLNKELASAAGEAQSSLSKLGKPIDLNLQKTIANMNQSSSLSQSNGQPGMTSSSGQQNANNNSSQSNGSGQSGGSGQGTNQGPSSTNSGNSSGQSGGSGQGQGSGSGAGAGSGSGSGSGGKGGLMGGTGSGGRDLLAVPHRIGGSSDTTVDSGKIGEGDKIEEKGYVPATRGDVRPYEEVVGTYKDSYMQSAERLQLPSDLQQMVQHYFTSIETD